MTTGGEEMMYAAWWENCSGEDFFREFRAYPLTVLRQIGVACDFEQAPVGSDQETFPTLFPLEAHRVLHAKDIKNKKG